MCRRKEVYVDILEVTSLSVWNPHESLRSINVRFDRSDPRDFPLLLTFTVFLYIYLFNYLFTNKIVLCIHIYPVG